MTKPRSLHCGWDMVNGVCICGANAKLPKVELAAVDAEINCRRCLNVLINTSEKDVAEKRTALTKAIGELDAWRTQKGNLP